MGPFSSVPFKTILAPVDLADRSRAIVQKAADLTRLVDGQLTLFHVVEAIDDLPEEEVEDFYASLEQRAQATLDGWAHELNEADVACVPVVVLGKRAAEIIRHAEVHHIDLVVMASRAVSPDHAGPAFGTISQQVALFARCPVMLLR